MVSTTGVVARGSLMGLVLVLLSACGGGDPPGALDAVPLTLAATPAVKAESLTVPGLVASPPEVVDNTRSGYRSVLAVGALDDGGHAVAWIGREAAQPKAPWQLWVQRYDRTGRKSGVARQLAYSDEVIESRHVAAVVRRDASIVVAWATVRPYQSTLPGLMASAIRARHFGLDGKPRSAERVIEEVLWQRGEADAETFEDLVVAAWRDGRYLVGWTVLDAWNRPACTVQRLAVDGQRLAPPDRLGPMAGRGLRLLPLETGGWLATILARAADGHLHANITQVDVHPAIGLPLLETLPLRSFVVDLGDKGRLLLGGAYPGDIQASQERWSLWFNPAGREADRTTPLSDLPTHTLALADGSWIGLWPHATASRLWAQRFDAHGMPIGGAMLTAAGRAIQAAPLPQGGALLAWVGPDTEPLYGTSVFTQRVTPRP